MPAPRAVSARTIETAKPKDKPYPIAVGEGLTLLVNPNGSRWWRFRYRFDGKAKMISMGVYPDISLAKAKEQRDAARKLVAEGIDPSQKKRADKVAGAQARANSFEAVALAWWEGWRGSCSPRHADRVWVRLKADIFPAFGSLPVNQVTTKILLRTIKQIEARGALDIAKRALQTCGQIMRYAAQHDLADRNPVADIKPKDALTPYKRRNLTRVDPKDLPQLLRDIDAYNGSIYTVLALKMMALTFVRTSELIGARWVEFDLDARLWRIPAERMKMGTPHIVPLSRQVLAVLDELRSLSGDRELLFPGERNPKRPISNNTLLYALYRMGYHSRMTGHGFRGVASTALHEMGFNHDHIEIQLAHQERNQVSASYNHATYLEQRARMMQTWADHLDALRAGGNVTPAVFTKTA